MYTQFDCQTSFSKTTNLLSTLKFSMLSFLAKYSLVVHSFSSVHSNPVGPEMPGSSISTDMLHCSVSYFSCTCLTFPKRCQSITVYLRQTVRFQKS